MTSTRTSCDARSEAARPSSALLRIAPMLALIAAVLAVLLWTAWRLAAATKGHLSYTIDDSHIHLRLAQQLADGTYGINSDTAAAPSSSVVWPLLLAPFGDASWLVWVPMVINVACTVGLAVVIERVLRRGWSDLDHSGWLAAAGSFVILAATGAFALAFSGMEHSLHVFVSVAVVLGVLMLVDAGRAPSWLWAAIAILPAIRYESVVYVVVIVVTLSVLGHARRALVAAAAGFVVVVIHSVALVLLGLPPVPSSVLVKSGSRGEEPWPTFVLSNLSTAFGQRGNGLVGPLLLVALSLLLGWLLVRLGRRSTHEVAVLLTSATSIVLLYQVATDPLTRRYLGYALVLALTVAAGVAVPRLRRSPFTWSWIPAAVLIVAIAGFGSLKFVGVLRSVPFAGRSIFDQQYQMHRFVEEELRAPVAVNDLGHVAFDSSHDVLDLIGLADDEIRRLRNSGESGWFGDVVQRRGVHVAIIYTEWFEDEIPSDWVRVGRLDTIEGGAPALNQVDVWASPAWVERAGEALRRFTPSDVERTKVTVFERPVGS